MRYFLSILVCLATVTALPAQQDRRLGGRVVEQVRTDEFIPIIGANVYWLGTTTGTTTDTGGYFSLPFHAASRTLVTSFIGYRSDTAQVDGQDYLRIVLQQDAIALGDVVISASRPSTYLEYTNTQRTLVMTEKELFKAACCNLSESFETNPSIDVTFTDAVTGTRQIEMLGLAGTYSQITTENVPTIRGLSSNAGLTYVPGTWIESIQISKGVGSVANGYESMTGQINVEFRKPDNVEEKSLFLNLFGDQDLRMEGNLNIRLPVSETWSSMTLLHGSTRQRAVDANGDRFLDMPLTSTLNLLQRFHYLDQAGLFSEFALHIVSDRKDGGTMRGVGTDPAVLAQSAQEYAFGIDARNVRLTGKTGYVFDQVVGRSVGFQWSYASYRQNAFFGSRLYNGRESSGYANLIYQTQDQEGHHKIRFGTSFVYDAYDEAFEGISLKRIERVPGAFVEYTFSRDDELAVTAGFRADHHGIFGSYLTPRLHIRYTPDPDWVIRAVAGQGRRTANIFAENASFLASSRALSISPSRQGYPFEQEVAWNYGLNFTHYFLWDYREATLTVDAYRTEFSQQVVADLDRNPQAVYFADLAGASFSNSVQAELNVQPVERLDLRLAYRYLDVRQTINGTLRERPLTARHRAFVNVAYATERSRDDEAQMLYDLTVQWYGAKRIPDTFANPEPFRVRSSSPSYALLNAQITRSFFTGMDLYLGIENLLNFTQPNPILDAANPSSIYFDSSLIWAPVVGRMAYLGVRWRI